MVVVLVDQAIQPRFFVRAAMDSASWPCFGVVMNLAVGLNGVDGLAIGGAISTGRKVAIGFFGLSLW